jgi:hypothetical protein
LLCGGSAERMPQWLWAMVLTATFACAATATAQPLKTNPTPQDYVQTNGGGATIVPPGQLVLDGNHLSCGHWATILDTNLDDYAASYPQFVILNMLYVAKVPTAVKLWIYNHECGHLFGGGQTRPRPIVSRCAAAAPRAGSMRTD